MKVVLVHKPTGYYVGGSYGANSVVQERLVNYGMSKDDAEILSGILGYYTCVWGMPDGSDPFEVVKERIGVDLWSMIDKKEIEIKDWVEDDDDEDKEDE